MANIRVHVVGSGVEGDAYRVELPCYQMVPGSWQPVTTGKITGDGVLPGVALTPAQKAELSCEVIVPDNEVDDAGRLSESKIRLKYRGQKAWDRPDVAKNVEKV